MSLSDPKQIGTIFMGPDLNRETTLDKLYDSTGRQGWTKQTESDYLDRVRAKATASVRALLVEARKRAEVIESEAEGLRREAEQIQARAGQIRLEAEAVLDQARQTRAEAGAIREAARREGLEDAREQVRAEIDQACAELGEATATVLLGIHEQSAHIFEAWRKDLAALLKEAVHKSTGLLVGRNRSEVLESLLDKSMRALLDRRQYTVLVHPADKELMAEVLGRAHKSMPRTANWEVAVDQDLEPGSLVVESESALVNNSQQTRRSVVDEILEHLSIPSGPADQEAAARVTATLINELHKNGVTLQQDASGADLPDPLFEGDPRATPESAAQAEEVRGQFGQDEFRPQANDFADPKLDLDGLAAANPAARPADEEALRLPDPPLEAPGQAETEAGAPHDLLARDEALDMVAEFLGENNQALLPDPLAQEPHAAPAPDPDGLDPDLADQLLAEMGFSQASSAHPES